MSANLVCEVALYCLYNVALFLAVAKELEMSKRQWYLGIYAAILTKMHFASLQAVTSMLILSVVLRLQSPAFLRPHSTTK